jgi:phosphate starvation-inducible PhoH-like protein
MATPRKSRRNEPQPEEQDHTPQPKSIKHLKPFNKAQEAHLAALKAQTCVYATGPAGTGKTFVMGAYAAAKLRDGDIDTLVVTRPTVEAGSTRLGFLKGDMAEKFAPWLWPFLKGFHYSLGKSYYEYLLKTERIQAVPLQYMQGMSFDNAIVLADEFENATIAELKMMLTRIGEGTRIFLAGDIQQTMARDGGLSEAISLTRRVPGVAHIEYTTRDIVRSDFVRHVLEAFQGVDYQESRPVGVFAP